MLFRKKKDKVKIIFLKPLGKDNYEKIAEKEIDKKEEIISFREKTFPLSTTCYIFLNSAVPQIFIDYENEKILKFQPNSILINARFLDMLLTTSKVGIIGQLIHAIRSDMKVKTDWVQQAKPIFWIILGIAIGYLIGNPNPFGA